MENVETENNGFDLNNFLVMRKELRDEVDTSFAKLKDTKKFDRADVIKVVKNLHALVSSLDNLTDVVINDLMIVDKRFAELEQRVFAIGQGHTVLRTLLVDQNLITQEDLDKVWNDKIKPELEAKIKQAKEAAEPKTASEIIESLPGKLPTGLVMADGTPV